MNNLEISAFIAAKKKSRMYIEKEIQAAQNLLDDMKAQKPVRWYDNFYYLLKRIFFISLASLAFLILVSIFMAPDQYRRYFDDHYDEVVTEFLNDNFGTHSEILVSETSATDQKIIRTKATKEIRADLQHKLVNQVYGISITTLQILLVVFTIEFWYIARLTRQLHLKNKQILAHYQVNLNLLDLYSEVVKEQKYEIDFLTHAQNNKY
ncbi:hypothetical protein [Sphingobacterium sp.]|uniref:hypothetical protein n=1 Tax=Sphingobacterium sp. TaxID=341027 RepID=UPI002FDA038A